MFIVKSAKEAKELAAALEKLRALGIKVRSVKSPAQKLALKTTPKRTKTIRLDRRGPTKVHFKRAASKAGTVRSLSEVLGVSEGWVYQILAGAKPSPELKEKLFQYLVS